MLKNLFKMPNTHFKSQMLMMLNVNVCIVTIAHDHKYFECIVTLLAHDHTYLAIS